MRGKVVRSLRRSYKVLPGQRILDACRDLGIQMSRGANLARCATEINAVAVVGGKAGGRTISVAVYSGKTGQALVASVSRSVGAALRVIHRGLKKAPRWVGARPEPKPAPAPTPKDTSPKSSGPDEPGGLTFEPDEVKRSSSDGPPEKSPLSIEDPSEDPLASVGKSTAKKPANNGSAAAAKVTKKSEPDDLDPKVAAYVGLGTWMRRFGLNDPASPRFDNSYSSGATFALRFALNVRPLAFFLDNFAKGVFLRMRYQMTVGLKSRVKGAAADGLGTSLGEFLFDAGYHWNILGKAVGSPRVDFGLGFGMLDFSIDWGSVDKTLPDASYRFVLLGVGASYPFLPFVGAHLRFDYRIVFNSGEVASDEAPGFGPSSTGGLSLSIGVNGSFMKIVARLEYTYTRYFYSFSDAQTRFDDCQADPTNCKPAAGGALDQMHGVMLSFGYSY